jgi:hypothetical protein
MSYRELSMIDVKELLRRWAAGQSIRRIARDTGADRGTVARYVAVAEQVGLTREREPSEGEVHEVASRIAVAWWDAPTSRRIPCVSVRVRDPRRTARKAST